MLRGLLGARRRSWGTRLAAVALGLPGGSALVPLPCSKPQPPSPNAAAVPAWGGLRAPQLGEGSPAGEDPAMGTGSAARRVPRASRASRPRPPRNCLCSSHLNGQRGRNLGPFQSPPAELRRNQAAGKVGAKVGGSSVPAACPCWGGSILAAGLCTPTLHPLQGAPAPWVPLAGSHPP